MQNREQTFHIDVTPAAQGSGSEALKLSFGELESATLYLNSPQARALASYLIQWAYQLDVKRSLKRAALTES